MAAQYRSGYHADIALLEFALNQFAGVCTDPGADQPRFFDHRAAKGNDALHGQLAGREEPADGHDVLVTDMPDDLVLADRIQEVDMRADEARRVLAAECRVPERFLVRAFAVGIGRGADVNRAMHELGQQRQAQAEGVRIGLDDDRRVCRQRIRIDRRDEQRACLAVRCRDFAERPRSQRRP